jgi:hypothetical protein
MARELAPAPFLDLHPLADLDAVAVDVEHMLGRVRIGRIEEAGYVNNILEVGVERIVGARSDCVSPRLKIPAHFFSFSRPMKSRLPSGTPLVRKMS